MIFSYVSWSYLVFLYARRPFLVSVFLFCFPNFAFLNLPGTLLLRTVLVWQFFRLFASLGFFYRQAVPFSCASCAAFSSPNLNNTLSSFDLSHSSGGLQAALHHDDFRKTSKDILRVESCAFLQHWHTTSEHVVFPAFQINRSLRQRVT